MKSLRTELGAHLRNIKKGSASGAPGGKRKKPWRFLEMLFMFTFSPKRLMPLTQIKHFNTWSDAVYICLIDRQETTPNCAHVAAFLAVVIRSVATCLLRLADLLLACCFLYCSCNRGLKQRLFLQFLQFPLTREPCKQAEKANQLIKILKLE